jgi:hypothetical protein
MDDGVMTSHGLGAALLFWVMKANRCLLEQFVWVWISGGTGLGALLQEYAYVLCITYDLECRNSRISILGRNSNLRTFDSRTSSIESSLLRIYESRCGGYNQVISGCWRLPPRFGRRQPCQHRDHRKKKNLRYVFTCSSSNIHHSS